MFNFILTAATAFIVSLAMLPVVIRFARKKKLLHIPGGRRFHPRITPSLGGVAIFTGFCVSVAGWNSDGARFASLLIILPVPFALGIIDDLKHVKPLLKLLGQAIIATLIFSLLDCRIGSFYGMLPGSDLSATTSYFATLTIIIFITNSFNLIDGIDGLAGAFSLIAFLFFGSWFHVTGSDFYSIVCFALSGAILAFLLLNWQPAKIFMGETGSLLIGVMLSISTIEFVNANHSLPTPSGARFLSSIGTALCVLIVPLTDTVRIIILRISRKTSPLKPDKRHIHHCLVRLGLSHRLTVSLLCATHILFISFAIVMRDYGNWAVITFATITAFILCLLLQHSISHHTYDKKLIERL